MLQFWIFFYYNIPKYVFSFQTYWYWLRLSAENIFYIPPGSSCISPGFPPLPLSVSDYHAQTGTCPTLHVQNMHRYVFSEWILQFKTFPGFEHIFYNPHLKKFKIFNKLIHLHLLSWYECFHETTFFSIPVT